ncbi:MAG TPA: hypothetical protein PKC43_03540 [Phycisphaerales bacterium]|nr:hypothetical protein [Phycisphaerales bacterium]HMP36502.1 hypothetical protein [Phycisphaerales bacterium]
MTFHHDSTQIRRTRRLLIAAAPALLAFSPALGDMIFVDLGDLPGGPNNAITTGVSNNELACGKSSSGNGSEAFLYNGIGLVGLGDLPGPGFFSFAHGISGDGTTVVGFGDGFTAGSQQAFRWTQATGMVGLGDLPGGSFWSVARATSGNGSVVVGYSSSANSGPNNFEAFRWTASAGMVGLGDLPGGIFESKAYACSADGNVIVGTGWGTMALGREAFRWTPGAGMIGLGSLPGGARSEAFGVSADGTVVVGTSQSAQGRQAFRWTAQGGMAGLGDLPGGSFDSAALAASGDGSVIVGRGKTAQGDRAFVWRPQQGMQDLRTFVISQGLAIVQGWTFAEATAISADGRTIGGWGRNAAGQTRGWMILNFPDPINIGLPNPDFNNDARVDAADVGLLLAAWGPCFGDGECPCDLNGDGIVDGQDLAELLGAWG